MSSPISNLPSLSIRLSPELSDPLAWAQLETKHRVAVNEWRSIFDRVFESGNPLRQIKREAAAYKGKRGFSEGNIQRHYYALLEGEDWTRFVHGNAMEKKGKKPPRGLPKDFVDEWKRRCIENQRGKVKTVRRKLIRDWRAGESIPGYGTWRDWWRREKKGEPPTSEGFEPPLPEGWSYPRLNAKRPTKAEYDLAHRGPKKFKDHLPGIMKTRKDLPVGAVTMWDDMWFNSEVYFGEQIVRALALIGTDVASTYPHTFGMQPRVRDELTGKRTTLSERDMRFLVAAQVQGVGFHKDGNVQMVERGTATIREKQEQALHDCSKGLIRVKRAGRQGGAFYDQFRGAYGGNTTFKAMIESLHNLIQNEAGFLPGQVGKNPADAPEEREGLNEHALAMIRAATMLPDHLKKSLIYPLPMWENFNTAIYEILNRISDRREHNLEGWAANNWTLTQYRIGERFDWQDADEIFAGLSAKELEAVMAMVKKPGNSRPSKLSPREVWQRGQADLIRLGAWHTPSLLGEDAKKEVRVTKKHKFVFKDRQVDAEHIVFPAYMWDLNDKLVELPALEVFDLYWNPYLPSTATVADAKGKVLGIVKRQEVPGYNDEPGLERQFKVAAKQEKVAMSGYKKIADARLRERKKVAKHNAAVFAAAKAESKAPVDQTPADRDAASAVLQHFGAQADEWKD